MSGDLEELEGCERAALSLQHVQAGTAGPVVNTDSVGTNCVSAAPPSVVASAWSPGCRCPTASCSRLSWLAGSF